MNFGHPSDDWPLRTLLRFCDRTPSALIAGPSTSSNIARYIYNVNHCFTMNCKNLSINRPTKRGKEKSPSEGHCQCRKEIDDHLLASQQLLTESHIVTRLSEHHF
jgi:hypothetical protein